MAGNREPRKQGWSVRNASHSFSHGFGGVVSMLRCNRVSHCFISWLKSALWKHTFWMSNGSADHITSRTLRESRIQCSTGRLWNNDVLLRWKNSLMVAAACADKSLMISESETRRYLVTRLSRALLRRISKSRDKIFALTTLTRVVNLVVTKSCIMYPWTERRISVCMTWRHERYFGSWSTERSLTNSWRPEWLKRWYCEKVNST